MEKNLSRFIRLITITSSLTLGFATFLAFASFGVLHHQFKHAEDDLYVLNFLQQEYELGQKTTALVTAYARSNSVPERKSLRENIRDDLRLMTSFLKKLQESTVMTNPQRPFWEFWEDPTGSSEIPHFFEPAFQKYALAVKEFLKRSFIHLDSQNPHLLAFQKKGADFLESLRVESKKYQEENDLRIRFAKKIGVLLLGMTVFCLVGIGVFIVSPIIKKIKLTMGELNSLNQTLEKRVFDRTLLLREKADELEDSNQILESQIRERQEAEEKLRQLNLAMGNALEGMAFFDNEGKCLTINKAYSAMLGRLQKDMLGKFYYDSTFPDDIEKIKKAYKKMIDTGRSEEEIRQTSKEGSPLYSRVVMVKSFNKSKDFIVHHLFSKDITEEKNKQTLEMKSNLVSMVSHELRTPLHSVREGINIVLEGLTGKLNDEQKDVLTVSKRCIDRLTRLINNVLDFQKTEVGIHQLTLAKQDINSLVKNVLEVQSPLLENKNLSIKICLDEKIPLINLDLDKITQVVTNLIGNAIKYTPENGSITASTSLDKKMIKVSIEDTGIGIRKEDFFQIFKEFGQIESSKKLAPGGAGLGLVISKKIIDQHSGKIWVESEYGKGSTFSFILPFSPAS